MKALYYCSTCKRYYIMNLVYKAGNEPVNAFSEVYEDKAALVAYALAGRSYMCVDCDECRAARVRAATTTAADEALPCRDGRDLCQY
jgi:hypothetical protein